MKSRHDVRIKRVYDLPSEIDGVRVLVDRLWPRGLHKSDVKMDYWLKNAAPSSDLRHWFDHDPAHWDEFKLRYRDELSEGNSDIKKLENLMKQGRITLLYAAHDPLHNHALVLQKFLDEQDI